ncbi:prolyl oligopeptidase family serine peptidase [Bdellovibrionota bacterium FG-2]
MGEYGNPDDATDPAMREAILKYSPYQNLKRDAHYPEVFFVTSTGDDRVHPGHARKMAARMLEFGHPFYYFENIEGGHGAAANLEQLTKRSTLEYSYFAKMLELKTGSTK